MNKKELRLLNKIIFIICSICLMISVSPWISAESSQTNASTIITKVFDNGLTLIIKPNPANEVVSVNAFIRMGAIYEPANQRGISKLMQLVITKGTNSRTAHDIVFETESVGASIDAGLGDFGYGVTSLKTTLIGLDKGLPVFLDVLTNPVFPDEEVAKEKQLMIQQLSSTEDQPTNVVIQNYFNLIYGNHPIGIKSEIIAANVQKFTREQLMAWYHKIYIPNNMVISIVGNVDTQKIANLFEKALGKSSKKDLPVEVAMQLPELKEDRQNIQTSQSQALFMVVGYPAPTIFDPDYPVMEVISYILGGDMSSRMFIELREKKGLAYNVSTGYYSGNYPSTIFGFMATEPGNYQEAKDGIIAEFRKITTELVPAEELAEAKEAIKGGYLMRHETNADQARFLGSYELLGLGYQQDSLYPELISKVTAADIQRVARKYFQYYTLSVVSPVEIK